MKRIVLPFLLVLPIAPLPARAGADSEVRGGCNWVAVDHRPGGGALFHAGEVWTGVVEVRALVYSSGDDPVSATVTCELLANGVRQSYSTYHGTVAVVGAKRLSYRAGGHVELCTTVDFTSDETPTRSWCDEPTNSEMPPSPFPDALDAVLCPVDCPPDPDVVPPECSDGLDNDLDGAVDYPADLDCWGPESDAEGLQAPT